MELILIKPVAKLGKVGQIVKVKDGYGRNFLLRQKLAIRYNEENKQRYEREKQLLEQKDQEAIVQAQAVVEKLIDTVVIIKQAAEDGRLYGSVNTKEIAALLSNDETVIDRAMVEIISPIKYVGLHDVRVSPHVSVSKIVRVNVARTETEAQEALKQEKEEGKSENQDLLDDIANTEIATAEDDNTAK